LRAPRRSGLGDERGGRCTGIRLRQHHGRSRADRPRRGCGSDGDGAGRRRREEYLRRRENLRRGENSMSETTPLPVRAPEVESAAARLAPVLRRTPLELSERLSRLIGVPVWLKREDLQSVRSYKL